MKTFWKKILYGNGYLLIGAAWLFTLSFIFSNYWSYSSSPTGVKKTLEQYIWQNEEEFETFSNNKTLISRLVTKTESENEAKQLAEKDFKVFLYRNNSSNTPYLTYWNTQSIIPESRLLQNHDSTYVATLSNGQYQVLSKLLIIDGEEITAVYLLPIRRQFVIESEYLKNGFVHYSRMEDFYALVFTPTRYAVNSKDGTALFYLQPKTAVSMLSYDWISITLKTLGSLFLLFFIHNLAGAISRTRGSVVSVLFMASILIGLRIISYTFAIPFNLRQFELFDPRIYSSSVISRSLGDLLINSILACWLVLFARTKFSVFRVNLVVKNAYIRFSTIFILVLSLVLGTLVCAHTIRTLVSDSQISFDVTNFFSMNIYSVIGFVVLCCISLAYFLATQTVIYLLKHYLKENVVYAPLLIAFVGLVTLSLRISDAHIEFELMVLGWLILYSVLLKKVNLSLNKDRFIVGNALFWLFIFSGSISAIIFFQNQTKELELRKRTAEKLILQADPSSERLLNIAIQGFSNNFFLSNLSKLYDVRESEKFQDSVINANFTPYLNKYDTELFFYDINEAGVPKQTRLSYDEINTIYSVQGKNTKIPGLKYYETAFDKFSYLFYKQIVDSSEQILAHFFMMASPKRYRSDAFYPELFRQAEDYSFEYTPDYAYAIYDSSVLLSYVNDYNFPSRLNTSEIPAGEFSEKKVNGHSELTFKSGNKIIIITKRSNVLMESITLFAYIFCSFLFLVIIFQLAGICIRSGFRWKAISEIVTFNVRSQIYATVIMVSIFSFVVGGAATILFYTKTNNKNNRDRLSRSIQDISATLKNKISDNRLLHDGDIQVYDSAYEKSIRQQITDLAQLHNADVNLYNSDGTLQISSQPFVYNKGVLSPMMDPIAYYNLHNEQKIQFMQEEQYGKMHYLSVYVPVMGEARKIVGYLNIPYFNSQNKLKQEISSFLVTSINLNAFIFLIAGVISLFLTNRITSSFTLINAMMREVNLGKRNAEIVWTRRDEIGELVKEYNKMVQKLDASATALAKTEREGAWREMARQVAHEIKNPLTPMKLSIQYLQKAINNNAPNVKDLSSTVAETLVEQIDHLSKIASEFSQFANIGNAKNEVFDIKSVLNSLVYLHDVQNDVNIIWDTDSLPLMVKTDKTQINRLFTNLLQNAIEAIPEGENGTVRIHEHITDNKVKISISDNGVGIPENMLSSIFTPNFTTKSSGTGLGLAICKGIVEQSRGSIWFETAENIGTTFYVELPLYEFSNELTIEH